ncbi:hypothetical protein HTZ84_09245 [Haloterrigena sp. SYSU A558-1]|uniref:Uncharacterized protein n=2 Tax=Haloterrigena gelatinilytica TaxID=2741724 RepID=A0A8J8GNR2_9EURY|nr:hypothetical protein [Haloterrigena gelatinilytica]NUB91659.1 hypothetical protein [Haloterrigena gelatinilytica]NUC72490.1 hypothetical protein [Haloterrigena gelatinilytica]
MAHKDDVTRVMAVCEECGSVYAAREWPDGTVRVIGQEGCSCGATSFEVADDSEGGSPSDPSTD